ncbi:hypothetical protein BH23VER1_BH23VER1_15630 [soil metagenome]
MRPALLILALLTFAALWTGPLPEAARTAFWAHMTMHMGVVTLGAASLAFAMAGTRLDPVRKWPTLFPPIPLSLVELVVVWAWHAPALHHAARHGAAWTVAEQASFLIAGFLVWISAFGGGEAGRPGRAGAGMAALLLTSMHMTLLGALLALAPRPLYHHGTGAAHAHALSPLDDQHIGGAIMLLVGGIAYLAAGLALGVSLLRSSHRHQPNPRNQDRRCA